MRFSNFCISSEGNTIIYEQKQSIKQKDCILKRSLSPFSIFIYLLVMLFVKQRYLQTQAANFCFDFQYISMNTASQSQQPPKPQKSKLGKIVSVIIIVLLISLALFFAIWHFGTQTPHQQIPHPLYSVFDQSPQHKDLLKKLQKSKKSIIYGNPQQGLQQFSQHLANKMSKQKTVFLEDYHEDHFQYFQFVREVKVQIDSLLNQPSNSGDWILQAFDKPIPQSILTDLINNNPNSKIVIITTNNTNIKGFKQFAFPAVKKQDLEKSIAKSLKVKPVVAEILHDYFGNADQVYEGLGSGKFDHQQLVGEHFSGLENLSKEDKAILQTLCTKGVAKSKKPSSTLSSAGVVYFKGTYYWKTISNVLNYELHSAVNCKNTAATEEVIKGAEEERVKFEQEQRKKEQEQRKKEEQLKAELARKEQQKKKKEQLQKAEAEKKKKAQQQKKKQESAAKTPKTKAKKQTATPPPAAAAPKTKKQGKKQK